MEIDGLTKKWLFLTDFGQGLSQKVGFFLLLILSQFMSWLF